VQHRGAGEIDVDMIESDERRGSHRICEVELTKPREFTRDSIRRGTSTLIVGPAILSHVG
jgi:hypothetical protein